MEIGNNNSNGLPANGVPVKPVPVPSGRGGMAYKTPVPLKRTASNPDVQNPQTTNIDNESAKPQPSEAEVVAAVEKLNKTAKVFDRKVRFEVDNQRGDSLRVYIVGDDDKVVRALPPDEVLDISARIQDALGLLFDKKA